MNLAPSTAHDVDYARLEILCRALAEHGSFYSSCVYFEEGPGLWMDGEDFEDLLRDALGMCPREHD